MRTFKRICLNDITISDGEKSMDLERGKEYITSDTDKFDNVTVFSTYWVQVSLENFAGEKLFTPS